MKELLKKNSKNKVLKIVAVAALTINISCAQQYKFDLMPVQEQFAQTVKINNKVDMLWIIDNSQSMFNDQKNYAEKVLPMVDTMLMLKMDFHIAIITTDMVNQGAGQFVGQPKYLTSRTPDLKYLLSQRILIGDLGHNNERGLDAMVSALSSNYLSGDGSGFLRPDATLMVFALSDEDDKGVQPSSYYANFLNNLKPKFPEGGQGWIMNFIGTLSLSNSCYTLGRYVEVGTKFIDLVNASGGIKESMCNENYTKAISNIQARILEIVTEYYLGKKPVEETIVVKVNGQTVANDPVNGWTYDPVKISVKFHGSAVPAADAAVSVDFKPAEAN